MYVSLFVCYTTGLEGGGSGESNSREIFEQRASMLAMRSRMSIKKSESPHSLPDNKYIAKASRSSGSASSSSSPNRDFNVRTSSLAPHASSSKSSSSPIKDSTASVNAIPSTDVKLPVCVSVCVCVRLRINDYVPKPSLLILAMLPRNCHATFPPPPHFSIIPNFTPPPQKIFFY